MNKPNFFLIGAPKCGTTAMAHYLAGHPQIFFSYPKEPYYWADDFPGLQRQFGVPTLDKYLQLFDQQAEATVAAGEGSTIYLASSTAVQRIIEFQPNARFIVMLRNPVDLSTSSHIQELSHLNEDEESFEVAWQLQEERSRGASMPRNCYEPRMLQYRHVASLGQQVERLFGIASRDRVHIIFFEDFQSSVLDVYQQTLDFLNLPYDDRREFPRINEGKMPRLKWLTQLLNGRTGTTASRFLKRRLKGPFRTFADRTKKILTMRKYTRPALSAEFRKRLLHEFSDDISLLADRTGRDLTHWYS